MRRTVWWLDASGRASGARAVSRALLATTGPWRLAGWLVGVAPLSWVASVIYRWIAANRHRLPGASGACATPARCVPATPLGSGVKRYDLGGVGGHE